MASAAMDLTDAERNQVYALVHDILPLTSPAKTLPVTTLEQVLERHGVQTNTAVGDFIILRCDFFGDGTLSIAKLLHAVMGEDDGHSSAQNGHAPAHPVAAAGGAGGDGGVTDYTPTTPRPANQQGHEQQHAQHAQPSYQQQQQQSHDQQPHANSYANYGQDQQQHQPSQYNGMKETPTATPARAPMAPTPHSAGGSNKKVFQVPNELRRLFNAFDTGQLGLTQFKEKMFALGIPKSPALDALLRNASYSMTYAQLIRACSQVVIDQTNTEKPARMGARPSTDVVTWRTSRGMSEAPETVPRTDHSLESHGAAEGMRRPSYDPRSAFISETQGMSSTQQHQQFSANVSHPVAAPKLRDAIYASIRALDSGSLSVDEFKKTLDSFGIPITKELSRLFMRHQASGTASFHEFSRAIDPMLAPHEHELQKQEERNRPQHGGSKSNVDLIGNARDVQHRPHKAHVTSYQSHGDVISWREEPGVLESQEDKNNSVRGKRLVDTHQYGIQQDINNMNASSQRKLGAVDLMQWDTESKQNFQQQYSSRGGPKVGVQQSSGDIISWATAPTTAEAPQFINGNRAPLSPSGRRRVAAMSSGQVPYGLDGIAQINSNTLKPTSTEGGSNNSNGHGPQARPHHGFSFAPPFGSEVDM